MPHWNRLISFLVLSFCLALGACDSTRQRQENNTRSADNTNGGGLWAQLRRSRAQKEKRIEEQEARSERLARTRTRFTQEQAHHMERLWARFMQVDPTWSEGRDEWRAIGEHALETFAENVVILMVRSYDIGNGVLFKHAQRELVELKDQSIPLLVGGLSGAHGDNVIRDHCRTVLATIGKAALPALQSAFPHADILGQLSILGAVSRLALPDAIPFLGEVVQTHSDFRVRITAIEGIGRAGSAEHAHHLVACLNDSDISVRKFSSGYLGGMGSKESVRPLIDCLSRAERSGSGRDAEVARNCRRSLRQLTRERFVNSRDWRAWWESQDR